MLHNGGTSVSNKFLSLKKSFNNRNIRFEYFKCKDSLISKVRELIEEASSIGIGNSKTLKHLNIFEIAKSLNKTVYDKTIANNSTEKIEIKRNALLADLYITSSNAITRDGKIVNVDHSGNRVAAMTFGPKKVLIIVSENKLVENEKEGLKRALKIATPLNAKRANYSPPCTKNGPCTECTQSQRVCNYLSVIRGQEVNNRMTVMLLKGSYGF